MYRLGGLLPGLREEEEGGYGEHAGAAAVQRIAEAHPEEAAPRANNELLKQLMEERKKIIENDKFSPKERLALLDDNRKAIVVANGGTIKRTENVVYGLLIFGTFGLTVLALLTTYAGLPHEVTLSFVGTVLGGTIATIAQKLGNL